MQHDLEANKPVRDMRALLHSKVFLEAAAILLLWSVLVINEGAIRVNDETPSTDLFVGRPSSFVSFLAGLFEFGFGVLGVYLGAAALLFRWYSTKFTYFSMGVQTLLGYYVFIVYTFVRPIFRSVDLAEPILPGLSLGESRFIISMGILTSFNFCLALQGGQFVFMARLVCAATGKDFLKQKSGLKMRAIFWNANTALSGLWTLITGAVINAKVGGGRLEMPFVSPPNVGFLPGLTIVTGLVFLLLGVGGIILAAMNMAVPKAYYIFVAFSYLLGLLNWGIVQFGLIPDDPSPSGAVAMHNGLVFMVVFIGVYFLRLAERERNGEEV